MCSELCKDFYVVYQLEMVAGEVESSCELVVTFFFFFFFGLTLPNYRNKSGSAQRSPPSYQLLPPPLSVTIHLMSLLRIVIIVIDLHEKKLKIGAVQCPVYSNDTEL